ncbi:MAG TPA: hypothetical protein VFQ54_12765, partial [Thermomicrobiales bacterium]|nr:hypothetical protein [Thermomicrobiales bacterium]
MTTQANRILTTHTGSLPRPKDLVTMFRAREKGEPVDPSAMATRIEEAVTEVVAHQRNIGIDVLNDGEASKFAYSTYVKFRLTGFGGDEKRPWGNSALEREFPDLAAKFAVEFGDSVPVRTVCQGPVEYRAEGLEELRT